MSKCGCPNQHFAIKNEREKIICQCCGKIARNNFIQWNANFVQLKADFVVLLKPSQGEFSRYKFGDDLHVGILHPSNSLVVSFCELGIVNEPFENWEEFGAIPLLKMDSSIGENEFDEFIQLFAGKFKAKDYSSSNWNCFDFVISFICNKYSSNFTKEQFVHRFVLPQILSILNTV